MSSFSSVYNNLLGMPAVQLPLVASFLNHQGELGLFARTCKAARAVSFELRRKETTLHLKNSLVTDQNLYILLQQVYPKVTHITITNCNALTTVGIHYLAVNLITRKMKGLVIKNLPNFTRAQKNRDVAWNRPDHQAAANRWLENFSNPVPWMYLVENLDFSEMTVFECSYALTHTRDEAFLRTLVQKLDNAPQLEKFPIQDATENLSREASDTLIDHLPRSTRHLHFPQTCVTDTLVDKFKQKFQSGAIRSCELVLFDELISPPKVIELLEFLPLETMEAISLSGEALTSDHLQQIGHRIQRNKTLKVFCIEDTQVSIENFHFLMASTGHAPLQVLRIQAPTDRS